MQARLIIKQYFKLTIMLYVKRDQNIFDQNQSPEQNSADMNNKDNVNNVLSSV